MRVTHGLDNLVLFELPVDESAGSWRHHQLAQLLGLNPLWLPSVSSILVL